MAGSGTVLKIGSRLGHRVIGFDLDPLAVLMSRVWLTPFNSGRLSEMLDGVSASASKAAAVQLSWIDGDPETSAFVDFWFGPQQIAQLRSIAGALVTEDGAEADLLRLALSRIIITKDRGASLARDTAHSRPHKAYEPVDWDVVAHFKGSAKRLADLLNEEPSTGRSAEMHFGDARRLTSIEADSIDLVVTSPPYLNGIDYLRGHRLALVWLGHRLGDLRTRRSGAMGTERGSAQTSHASASVMEAFADDVGRFSRRNEAILWRYAHDLLGVVGEIRRVLRARARAVLVIGNSFVEGMTVDNASAAAAAGRIAGLHVANAWERVLPNHRRYLPPPSKASELGRRLRTETVLEFVKAA